MEGRERTVFLIRRDETASPQAEALAAYVDRTLLDPRADAPDAETAALVGALRAELRPVEPRAEFVEDLRLRLIAAADQRVVTDESIATWRQPRFIIGAAGLVSAAAVLAFVARSRMTPRAA